MIHFKFICLLVLFSEAMKKKKVNRILEGKIVSILVALNHLQDLMHFLNDFRKNQRVLIQQEI